MGEPGIARRHVNAAIRTMRKAATFAEVPLHERREIGRPHMLNILAGLLHRLGREEEAAAIDY